jgi:hypothetical protein
MMHPPRSALSLSLTPIHTLNSKPHVQQVLECPTETLSDADRPDLAGQLAAFGRRYVTTDSITALQYYMLAAAVSGQGLKEQGKLFRELLVQSRDYGKSCVKGRGGAFPS